MLQLIAAWCALALAVTAMRVFAEFDLAIITRIWVGLGVLVFLAAIIDRASLNVAANLKISRKISLSQALGVTHTAELAINNTLGRTVRLTLAEAPNPKLHIEKLPLSLSLAIDDIKRVRYSVTPVDRGDTTMATVRARVNSVWSLWQRDLSFGEEHSIKIYPNYIPLVQIAELGLEHQLRQLGVHISQRRGQGMDFKQLREFIEGDAVRQIDWRATARYRKPISREYQDERNQDIFILLDCGRRMRHKDNVLNHFNYSLNAVLLLSYVAANQGDAVGLGTFAGEDRWLKPVTGTVGVNKLLDQLYDLETSTEASDYLAAAQMLQQKHRRRSLVVLVTNLRTEDADDLIRATKLLSKQHLVVVASLREKFLDETLNRPVDNFNAAIDYAATTEFMQLRQKTLATLKGQGVVVVDTLPETLHVHLVDEYLRLKRSNRL